MTISQSIKFVRADTSAAAGTDDTITSDAVDTKGFGSVCFIVAVGAVTASAVTSFKIQGSDVSGSGYTDLLGTSYSIADDEDDMIAYVEVVGPVYRYLKLVITRATANAVIDGVFALLSNAGVEPVSHDATTVIGGEVHLAPIAGTA